jgi:hypothetical protein
MAARIKTTGQLRSYLVEVMEAVKTGETSPDLASKITKLAAQVNESFYSEIKIARVQREAGIAAADLGGLLIGERDPTLE